MQKALYNGEPPSGRFNIFVVVMALLLRQIEEFPLKLKRGFIYRLEKDGMISIILPTLNEADNLPSVIPAIFKSLSDAGLTGEVIVVDDASPDGTAEVAEELAGTFPVRVIKRQGRLGLAAAVIDGFALAQGEIIGIMDADGSHDPAILPAMIHAVQNGVDLAIGSRYLPGGGTDKWPFTRRLASKVAIMMATLLTAVKDATSGYLVFKRSVIEGVTLLPLGFKIGLEIIVKGHYLNLIEIPYTFKDRTRGASKLGGRVVWNYLWHLFLLYRYQLSCWGNKEMKQEIEKPVKIEKSVSRLWWFLFILFAAGVAIWNLGQAPLSDAEAFYAETAREMHERKEWLIPYFNYARFFDKPPLYYWLEIAAYHIFGVNEFASRLPAAMAFAGIVGLTALAGKILFDDITGLIAGFIFLYTMGFYLYSHMVLVEPVLSFFIVGALVTFLLWYKNPAKKCCLYTVYVCMALAVLTKGLTGIVFPSLIIGLFLITAASGEKIKQFFNLKAVLCFILVALPWHIWAAITNKGFLWFYFVHEQLLRFFNLRQITDAFLGTLPFLGTMFLILFPWSLFLIPAVLFCLSEWRQGKGAAAPRWFLILWVTVVVGFFCLSKYKLEYYSFPAWPAIILLVAHYWRVQIASPCKRFAGINICLIILFLLISIILVFPSLLRLNFYSLLGINEELAHVDSFFFEWQPKFTWLYKTIKQTVRLLFAASGIALFGFWIRRPWFSLLSFILVMLPIFVFSQKGILLLEPFLSSRISAQEVGGCLNKAGGGKIVHEETEEDIYIGGIAFYTGQKVWLLKPKEKQRFPFPFKQEEIYYITQEDFARLWNSKELLIFIGDPKKVPGRSWLDKGGEDGEHRRYPMMWGWQYKIGIHTGQSINKPICGVEEFVEIHKRTKEIKKGTWEIESWPPP